MKTQFLEHIPFPLVTPIPHVSAQKEISNQMQGDGVIDQLNAPSDSQFPLYQLEIFPLLQSQKLVSPLATAFSIMISLKVPFLARAYP